MVGDWVNWQTNAYAQNINIDSPTLPPMSHLSHRQRTALATAKVAIAGIILYFLFTRIQASDGFSRLVSEPKNWLYLVAAWGLVLVGFSLSFVRWYLFVSTLGLNFHLRDAFRLGTLGFMFNQISPGSIGGDLLKAVFIAREQQGNRTEAIATGLIDRAVGLYGMLIVGSAGLLLVDEQLIDGKLIHQMRLVVWSALGIGTLGFAWAMSPLVTGKAARETADRLPIVGHTLSRLIDAAAIYHQRRSYVFIGLALAVVTHTLLVSAFWLTSQGLPVFKPTFTQNASIVPPCLLAGTLPLTPGGIGTMEGTVEFFYTKIGAPEGDGTIVALAFRAMTYAFAAVGACYYVTARRKIDQLLHEAEELAEELD